MDNEGNGEVWQFGSDPTGEGTPPGTDGQFAIADSNAYGPGNSQDTSLVSPVLNLSKAHLAGDQLRHLLQRVPRADRRRGPQPRRRADLDQRLGADQHLGVQGHVSIPIPQAAGQSNVQVRFHFISSFGWWWSLDNVFIGNQKCVATPGGSSPGS